MTASDALCKAIESFHSNLDALREFFDVAHPHLTKHEEENVKRLLPLAAIFQKVLQEPVASQIKDDGEGEPMPDGVAPHVSVERKKEGRMVSYSVECDPGFDWAAFKGTIDGVLRSRGGTKPDLLGRAALMLLASTAEWYAGQLFHALLEAQPERLNSSDMSLPFKELMKFDSIDDARHFVAEARIESILRGPVESWIDQLKKDAGLTASYIGPYRDDLVEAFVRRNVLVHNGGLVNAIYLNRVPSQSRSGVKHGDRLSVDKVYLENTINLTETVFVLLGSEVWKKLHPEDNARPALLARIAFRHLEHQRWKLAEHLSQFIANDRQATTEVERQVAQINVWQARKWLGLEAVAVANEVRATDASALAPVFRLARHALLDEHAECALLAKKLLRAGDVSLDDLQGWPLFREARKHPQFAKLIDDIRARTKKKVARGVNPRPPKLTVTLPVGFLSEAAESDQRAKQMPERKAESKPEKKRT
ncbi:MAG: hypothetical protein KF764_25990 [Labilithrix sp.]|nr:hypothetical protein [Labilithrix sp.]